MAWLGRLPPFSLGLVFLFFVFVTCVAFEIASTGGGVTGDVEEGL